MEFKYLKELMTGKYKKVNIVCSRQKGVTEMNIAYEWVQCEQLTLKKHNVRNDIELFLHMKKINLKIIVEYMPLLTKWLKQNERKNLKKN